ncbi:MAG: hypothetical protein QW728_02895, partial [Thermoplasmata archaeon]
WMECWSSAEGDAENGCGAEEQAWDKFPAGMPKKYRYYMTYETLIEKHAQAPDRAYFDTLYYIVESINQSVKRNPGYHGVGSPRGLMDTMAQDAKGTEPGNKANNIESGINPKDTKSLLRDGLEDMDRQYTDGQYGLEAWKGTAQSNEDDYWGAFFNMGDSNIYSDWPLQKDQDPWIKSGPTGQCPGTQQRPKSHTDATTKGKQAQNHNGAVGDGVPFFWHVAAETCDLIHELFWTFMMSSDTHGCGHEHDDDGELPVLPNAPPDRWPPSINAKDWDKYDRMHNGKDWNVQFAPDKYDYFNWRMDALQDLQYRVVTNIWYHIGINGMRGIYKYHTCADHGCDAEEKEKDDLPYGHVKWDLGWCCDEDPAFWWFIPAQAWAQFGRNQGAWEKITLEDGLKHVDCTLEHMHCDESEYGATSSECWGFDLDNDLVKDTLEATLTDGRPFQAKKPGDTVKGSDYKNYEAGSFDAFCDGQAHVGDTIRNDIRRMSGKYPEDWWLKTIIDEQMFPHLKDNVDQNNLIIYEATNLINKENGSVDPKGEFKTGPFGVYGRYGTRYILWDHYLQDALFNKTDMNETTYIYKEGGNGDMSTPDFIFETELGLQFPNGEMVENAKQHQKKGQDPANPWALHLADAQDDYRKWYGGREHDDAPSYQWSDRDVYRERLPENQNLAEAPYMTRWKVAYNCTYTLSLRTLRFTYPSDADKYHIVSEHKDVMRIEADFFIDLYTGWDLYIAEGNPLYYSQMRSYFFDTKHAKGYWYQEDGRKKDIQNTLIPFEKRNPVFGANELTWLMNETKDGLDWFFDSLYGFVGFSTNILNEAIEKNLQYAQNISDMHLTQKKILNAAIAGGYLDSVIKRGKNLKEAVKEYVDTCAGLPSDNKGTILDMNNINNFTSICDNKVECRVTEPVEYGQHEKDFEGLFKWESSNFWCTDAQFAFWQYKTTQKMIFRADANAYGWLSWGQWDINGAKFNYTYLFHPSAKDSMWSTGKEVNIGQSSLNGNGPIWIEQRHFATDVKFGAWGFKNDNIITAVEDKWRGPSPEWAVTYSIRAIGSLIDDLGYRVAYNGKANSGSYTGGNEMGIYYDIGLPNTGGERLRVTYKLHPYGPDNAKQEFPGEMAWDFLVWLSNSARTFFYNLGNPEFPSTAYCTLPFHPDKDGSKDYNKWIFWRLDNYHHPNFYNEKQNRWIEANIPGTMSALEFTSRDYWPQDPTNPDEPSSSSNAFYRRVNIFFGTEGEDGIVTKGAITTCEQ